MLTSRPTHTPLERWSNGHAGNGIDTEMPILPVGFLKLCWLYLEQVMQLHKKKIIYRLCVVTKGLFNAIHCMLGSQRLAYHPSNRLWTRQPGSSLVSLALSHINLHGRCPALASCCLLHSVQSTALDSRARQGLAPKYLCEREGTRAQTCVFPLHSQVCWSWSASSPV